MDKKYRDEYRLLLRKSTCCESSITLDGDTTKHHICVKCYEPCNSVLRTIEEAIDALMSSYSTDDWSDPCGAINCSCFENRNYINAIITYLELQHE